MPSSFGSVFRRHRENLGLTVEQVAEKTGLAPQAIARVEAGRPEIPEVETRLASAVGSSSEKLLLEVESENLFESLRQADRPEPVATAMSNTFRNVIQRKGWASSDPRIRKLRESILALVHRTNTALANVDKWEALIESLVRDAESEQQMTLLPSLKRPPLLIPVATCWYCKRPIFEDDRDYCGECGKPWSVPD